MAFDPSSIKLDGFDPDNVIDGAAPAKAEQGDYLRGLKKYVPQMQEMYGAGKALVGKAIDSEGMVQSGIETMQDANRKVEEIGSKPTDEFTNVKSVGDFADWAQHGLGQVTGNLAESLVAAGAGTLLGGALGNPITAGVGGVGGLVGKQILKKALKEQGEAIAEDQAKKIIGKEVGQNAAISGMAGFHGAGETGSRAFQEANYDPNQVELGQVLPRAAGHAAAEFLGDKILLGGMLGKGAYRAAGEGAYPLVKTVSGNMAIVAGKEIPVELVQTVLERDAAKLDLMSPEARDEYINTAAQTMLFGIAGAPAGVRSYMAKPPQQTHPMTQEEAAADLSASNTELAGATAAYDALPSDVPQIGYNGKPDAIIVPNQSGGTTEINRNDGALSAAVVDTGITGQMLDNGTTLVPFASRDAAQSAIDQREDADRLTVVPHPRVSGRFAMVPKDRLTLEAQDQAAMRRQQLEQEDGNAPQLDEAGSQGRGSVSGGGGGNASAISGIGGGSSNTSASSVPGRGTSMAMGTADATESALALESAQSELAPATAQPVASMPGVQARNAERIAAARIAAEARGTALVDEEAAAANTSPSEAQIAAGNYKKGHIKVGPLDISVENPIGSTRSGKEGKKSWTTTMRAHYGYIKRTVGADGDQVDVFVKEGTPADHSGTVYVIDQFNPKTGRFDEHKGMIGYSSQADAARAYDDHFGDKSGPKRRKAVIGMPAATFSRWAKEGDTTSPISQSGRTADEAQAEIEKSTGKLSTSRQKAAGRDPYAVAQEANDRRSERTTGTPEQAPDNAAVARTIGATDFEEVKDEALPDAKDTDAPVTLTKQGAKSLRMLAKLFGKKIVIFKTDADADGFYINGNTIYIKSDSSVSQLRVLGHEMMHALRRQAPKVYQQTLDAVSELLTDAELKAFYADYNNGKTMPAEMSAEQRDALVEEWMADLGGNRWGEAEFWSSMFAKLEEQHGTTLAKKIINQLRMAVVKVINSLLRTIRGGTMFAVDRRMADNLEKIREAMAQGFADYAKAVRDGRAVEPAGEGGVKFSGKKETAADHKMQITREERELADKTKLTKDEMKRVRAGALEFELPYRTVEVEVRRIKANFPESAGWAPLTFLRVDKNTMSKKATEKTPLPSQAIFFVKQPYRFHLDGQGKADKASRDKRVKDMASALAGEIVGKYMAAQQGDKNADVVMRQSDWYRALRGKLRATFGGFGDFLAQLLGPTSANNPVEPNFKYGVEALKMATSGKWDNLFKEVFAWKADIDAAAANLDATIAMVDAEGVRSVKNDPRVLKAVAGLKEASKYKGTNPVRENGKMFGMASDQIVQILAETWGDKAHGDAPKTKNYYQNIMGRTFDATIDVWAARTLRRIANDLVGDFPRIPPVAEDAVSGQVLVDNKTSGAEFGFGQDVFQQAAEDLKASGIEKFKGITPDAVQAMVWFIEKETWSTRNWTTKIGEEGSIEHEMLMAGYADRAQVDAWRVAARAGKPNPTVKSYSVEASVASKEKALAEKFKKDTAKWKETQNGEQPNQNDKKYQVPEGFAKEKAVILQSKYEKDVAAWEEAKEIAKAELAKIEKYPDRFVAGVTAEIPGDKPTDTEMAGVAREIEMAAADDKVMAIRAQTTAGDFMGSLEKTLDVEAVTRNGYDAAPLWNKLVAIGQREGQQATFLSRVLREDEKNVDPLLHRPGVELYFVKPISRAEAQPLIDVINAAGIHGMTMVTEGRRTPSAMAGNSQPIVGIRMQHIPEFMLGFGYVSGMSDASIEGRVKKVRQVMRRLVRELAKRSDVSTVAMHWYETRVHFYGNAEGNTGAGSGRGTSGSWSGQPISEALASADRFARHGEEPLAARRAELAAERQVSRGNAEQGKLSPARYGQPAANGGVAGQGRPGDRQLGRVDVTGTHYSREQRKRLTGGYFGTGLAGEEGKRLKEAKDTRLHSRLYAYVNEGQGVFPEAGVGAYAHTVKLDNLYDIKADPLGIRQKTRDANDRESLILDAGFDGYYAPGVFGRQGVAILMGGAATRGVTPTDTVAPAVNAETAPKTERRTDLPMGKMTGAEWKKLEPRATDLEDGKMYYRDEVKFSPGRGEDDHLGFDKWSSGLKISKQGDIFETGKPVVVNVLHGSPNAKKLRVFDSDLLSSGMYSGSANDKLGWHFTSDVQEATKYATQLDPEDGIYGSQLQMFERVRDLGLFTSKGGGNLSVFVRLDNPLVMSMDQYGHFIEGKRSDVDLLRQYMSDQGYDGIVVTLDTHLVTGGPKKPFDDALEASREKMFKIAKNRGESTVAKLDSAIRDFWKWESYTDTTIPLPVSIENMSLHLLGENIFAKIKPIKEDLVSEGTDLEEKYPGIPLGLRKSQGGNIWVVVTPEAADRGQIKSATDNRGAFDAANPDIRYSPPRWYFSPLEKAFESAPDKVFGQAAQVKLWLAGNKSKLGLKDDEIFWTGINDWLDMQGKQKVSKADVLGYLAGSGVQVEEVMKGVPGYDENDPQLPVGSGLDVINATDGATGYEVTARNGRVIGRGKTEADAIADAYSGNPDYWEGAEVTNFGQYTLPGGESYRELLLTLPPKGAPIAQRPSDGLRKPEQIYADPTYRSSHWEEPNILAHIRMNDRTDADGKRVLFVEEIQSDWNQEGRKKGFVSEGKLPDGWSVEEVKVGPYSTATKWAVFDNSNTQVGLYADTKEEAISSATKRNGFTGGVQTGPFVTDTKATVALAVKRIMAYAAANSYDKVAFINGEQSADRYDLSKQVGSIDYRKNPNGTYDISTTVPNGTSGPGKSMLAETDLEGFIGKDIAEKIVRGDGVDVGQRGFGSAAWRRLSGLDLKVGGEGMKAFYDRIVPQVVSDQLKKVGGKMETVRITLNENLRSRVAPADVGTKEDDNGFWVGSKGKAWEDQPAFTVTPKMSEPLPLFSPRRTQTDTPEFKKWFKDSKVVDADGKPLRVYHVTTPDEDQEGIEVFDTGRGELGAHFGTPEQANTMVWSDEARQSSIPAYLAISNPLRLRDMGGWTGSEVTGQLADLGLLKGAAYDEAVRREGTGRAFNIFIQQTLRKAGYDGIVYLNRREGTGVDAVIGEEEMSDSEYMRAAPAAKDSYIAFSPTQIKSAIGNNGQFDPSNPDIRKSTSRIIGASTRPYSQDHTDFFKRVGRTIDEPSFLEKLGAMRSDFGKKMATGIVDQFRGLKDLGPGGMQAYMLSRLSKGASGAFDALLHHGKLRLRDNVYDADTSGGFVDRLGIPLNGELEDFMWWVAANRADTLAAQGKENLFSPQDIAAGKSLATGQTTFDYTLPGGATTRNRALIYKDALRIFNEFNKNTLDMAEQSGLIDGASRPYWENQFYVPFYRVSEEDNEFIGSNIKSGLVRQRAFQKLKGGTDKLNSDLLSNTLLNWSHLIDASAKNRAAKASLQAAEQAGVAQKVAPDMASYAQSNGALLPPGTKKTVWYMDNGQKQEYKVTDPFVMTAITGLEYAGMRNPIMDTLSKFKHWLTVGVTASPAFKVRNLIRDSLQAIGASELGYNPVTNVVKGFKASNRASQDYVSALAGGGLIRFGTMLEGSESSRVRQLIKSGVKDSSILNSESKLQQFYDRTLEPLVSAYNEIGNRGEEINRMALYKQLVAQGRSHAEASLLARDLMDFSMQGSFNTIRFLTQIVPFMNARLQGMYKLGRAAKDDPRKLAIVTGATALFSIALMMASEDDDDWKKREDWDRDNFWWFKIGDTAWRIPKPFEVGAVATLAERSVELMLNDEMNGERYRKILKSLLLNNLSMNPVPQAIKPIVDLYANKDSFTGRPIENMSMQRLDPTERYTANTSLPARAVSASIGGALSPVQVDHIVRGYFSWLGTFVVGGADMLSRAASNEPTRPTMDYLKFATQGIGQEVGSGGSRYITQMYDQANELEQAHATWNHLKREGRIEEAREYMAEHADELKRYKPLAKVKEMESKLNERIRAIERSNIDPDQKKTQIDNVKKMKDQVARRVAPGID